MRPYRPVCSLTVAIGLLKSGMPAPSRVVDKLKGLKNVYIWAKSSEDNGWVKQSVFTLSDRANKLSRVDGRRFREERLVSTALATDQQTCCLRILNIPYLFVY